MDRMRKRPPIERFWPLVAKGGPDDCWEWTGFRNRQGYGRFFDGTYLALSTGKTSGRKTGAHRWSYKYFNGDIPPGAFVCHRCDNPPCVNPRHLFIGSAADNSRDMTEKARACHGEGHRLAKLTRERVDEIRSLFAAGSLRSDLARQYGVTWQSVDVVVKGKTWR